jgi:hypothetical protein
MDLYTKSNMEALDSKFHNEIMLILRANNELFTEKNNGFFFDLNKVKECTRNDICDHIKHCENFIEKSEIKIFESKESNLKIEQPVTNHSFSLCPKIVNEYNLDLQKAQQKGVTLIKFMSAKKKYIRSSEISTLKNEPDLKKEHYNNL